MGLEQLKELVAAQLSPDEIMDILGWTTYDLVEKLEEELRENEVEFRNACYD